MKSGSAIFIGTTEGPVQVLSVLRETGDPPSAVFLNGGTSKMRISAAYREFVERPSGFVERLCGHRAFRTDLSGRIDGGESWQLGMLVAHIAEMDGQLVRQAEEAERIIWCSGAVRNVPGSGADIAIGAIERLSQKLQLSAELFRDAAIRDVEVWVVLCDAQDTTEIRGLLGNLCAPARVATFGRVPLADFRAFWRGLGRMTSPDERQDVVLSADPARRRNIVRVAWLTGIALTIGGLGGLAYYSAAGIAPAPSSRMPVQPSSQGAQALALPSSAEPAAKSDSETRWLEGVEVDIRASVASAGQDCFSGSAEPLATTSLTLQRFRTTAVEGRLCGARLVVTNRTPRTIVVGVTSEADGEATGLRSVQADQFTYLVLGPAHRDARIVVRSSTQPDAVGFSAPLFSGAN